METAREFDVLCDLVAGLPARRSEPASQHSALRPDFLTNYEIGWKTTFGPLRWNGDIFHEKWKKFQFAFLGANSFTEIHNGKDARINGLETDINYVRGGWSLSAAAAYTDAKTKGNICTDASDTTPNCDAVLGDNDTPSDPTDDPIDFPSVPSGASTAQPLGATGGARSVRGSASG